jgi:hypothetical protein
MMATLLEKCFLMSLTDCCTIPLSSYAGLALLSFEEGIPNSITALIPAFVIPSTVLIREDKGIR